MPRSHRLKPATLFYYVNGAKLSRGWPLDDLAMLAIIILVAATIGGVVWHRRDLPL